MKEIAAESLHSEDPAIVAGGTKLAAAIEEHLARPEHAWYTGNLSPEERQKRKAAQEEFKSRYGKD